MHILAASGISGPVAHPLGLVEKATRTVPWGLDAPTADCDPTVLQLLKCKQSGHTLVSDDRKT
jgi:hypothetical protein